MESENGLALEDESSFNVPEGTNVEVSVPDLKKESENIDGGETNDEVKYEHVTKPKGPDSSGAAGEASVNVVTKPVKGRPIPNGGISKNSKMAKEKPNSKTMAPSVNNRRPVLSQSASFPARRGNADTKKSVDGHLVKTNSKHARASGNKAEVPVFNGSANHPNGQASMGVNPKEANTGADGCAERNSIASIRSTRRSMPVKSTSTNTTTQCPPPSEVSLLVDQNTKPARTSLPITEDDDTYSTTSGGRRSSISGFASRLDERAEKRKEFYSELEKKIQAKEAEMTNLQEKSKENQEAEIKQLRKSMTFKATPMPTFYKETPPKVELKKIPNTRAISPKLGRHKTSTSMANNSSEETTISCPSPHLNREQNNAAKRSQAKGDKDTKKPIKKSQQPKLQSQEPTSSKTAVKPAISKRKTTEAEPQSQIQPIQEHEDRSNIEPEMYLLQNDEAIMTSLSTEIMPHEVAVGC